MEEDVNITYTLYTIFANSAPLGWVSHRIAMSVCLFVCLRHWVQFFRGLSLALRSHDQFQASHWSSIPPSLPWNLGNLVNQKFRNWKTWKLGILETWKLGNLETWKLCNLEISKLGNLETWTLGNLETWKPGNLGTWILGNLGTWELWNLETRELGNFGTWKLGKLGT